MAQSSNRRHRMFPAAAARRAVRAAIVMPIAFAGTTFATGSATAALFAAFGSIILLLYVDASGPIRQRLATHAGLVVAGLVLVAVGTASSSNIWLAVPVTLVVVFCLLFAGIVSSVVASAQGALLISFMLPVMIPGPIASTPDRLLGWLIAGAASFIAIAVILPGGTGIPLRSAAAKACVALSERLRDESIGRDAADPHAGRSGAAPADAYNGIEAVAHLRDVFFNAPYRPSGLATSARILIVVIDQIFLLVNVLDRSRNTAGDAAAGRQLDEPTAAALDAAADALSCCGRAMASVHPDPSRFDAYLERMLRTRTALQNVAMATAPTGAGRTQPHEHTRADTDVPTDDASAATLLGSFEPLFRAHEASLIASAITTDVQRAAAARQRSIRDKVFGREPAGLNSRTTAAWRRVRAQLDWRSVWLHNSIRGAVGFALTVVLADLTGAQHAFWIAFGALAVLRSNAANTGQSAIRAMVGTVIGIILGSLLVVLIGDQSGVTWVLLPIAIVVTGIAPEYSFIAGQAGFSVTLLLLFNTMGPSGWSTGVIRVEDMALGCGVSVLVALLLWPRGAAARFNHTLADAMSASATYVTGAVTYALTRCEHPKGTALAPARPDVEQRTADDAARRLDDVLRQFLAERGVKNIAPADLATVVLAVAALRRAADAICELWARDDAPSDVDRRAARAELLHAQGDIAAWYQQVAGILASAPTTAGSRPAVTVPDPTTPGDAAADRLLAAVAHDLESDQPGASGVAIKLIWTHDHLEVIRRLESDVCGPARILARGSTRRLAWLFTWRRPINDRMEAVRRLSRKAVDGARLLSR